MGNVYSEPSVISLLEVLRSAIVYHILFIPHLFAGDGPDGESKCITLYSHPRRYNSVEQYILQTRNCLGD